VVNYRLRCLSDSPDISPDQSPIKESICDKSKINICFILNKLLSQHPQYGTHSFEVEMSLETLEIIQAKDERINQASLRLGASFRGIHVIFMQAHLILLRYQDVMEMTFQNSTITVVCSDG
jgi:hypothetical protein